MPTRSGFALLIAGVSCLLGGFLLGYPQLDVLGCAAVLAIVLALAAVAWRPSLELSRDLHPEHVTRGEPAVCVLTVRNAGRLPLPPVIVYDRLGDRRVPVEVPFLRAGAETTVTYRLDTARRGVFNAGPLRWERRDALGLAAVGRSAGDIRRLCVHPLTHPMVIVPSGRARNPEGPTDMVLASGATFHQLREYVAGDDLRHVHWPSSARTGELMVRENLDTSLPATTVLLDTSFTAYDDDSCFEEAIELAASVLTAAVRLGFPARITTGKVTMEARGDARDIFDYLANLTLGAEPGLARLVDALPRRQTGVSLIAVTGSTDGHELAALRRIAPRHDRTALVLLHPEGVVPAVMADRTVSVITATHAAEACARWNGWVGP